MHISFVGFGAVGFVLVQMIEEWAVSLDIPLSYSIIVRTDRGITQELANLGLKAEVTETANLFDFLSNGGFVSQKPDRTINVATPLLNIPTMQRCLHQKSNYMDLASNIQPENIRSGQLEQLTLHEAFKQAGLLAVINAGISPGITELLAGYGIARHRLIPRSYSLLLRENFVAEVPLFSRSPSVAIDEVLTPAFMIEDGNPHIQEAFTTYHDPHVGKKYYFITQEESFAMYSHYKDTLSSLVLATGGAEVEAVMALNMIGLLSTEPVGDSTYLQIVKDKMPRAASRQEVISAIENNHLEDARFDFILEVSDAAHAYRATMHFNTEAFAALAGTPYYGSTTISYTTGAGAASIWGTVHDSDETGVITCLDIGLSASSERVLNVIKKLKEKGLQIDLESEEMK